MIIRYCCGWGQGTHATAWRANKGCLQIWWARLIYGGLAVLLYTMSRKLVLSRTCPLDLLAVDDLHTCAGHAFYHTTYDMTVSVAHPVSSCSIPSIVVTQKRNL